MSKAYEFLKECGIYFLVTMNGASPAARPFGCIVELGNELYFTTSNKKAVYTQLIQNRVIQIVALKAGTRDWIRIDGKAVEVYDLTLKQAVLDVDPDLLKHFKTADCVYFALFKIIEMQSSL